MLNKMGLLVKAWCWMVVLSAMSIAHAQEFLPPEQAFKVHVQAVDPTCHADCLMNVRIEVAQGYYLYRERFKLEPVAGVKYLDFVQLPKGDRKFDEFLNQEIEALRGELSFQVRYALADGASPQALGNLVSQGCADAGLCYPPMLTALGLMPTSALGDALDRGKGALSNWLGGAQAENAPMGAAQASATVKDESSELMMRLSQQPAWLVLPAFFGLGLLLAFTPCTLPMLPILSSLIVGQQGAPQGARGARPVGLALVYVLGMSLTYAVLGVLAGLSGQSLVVALQQPPVLWAFGGLLGALGLVMLLGYSLQMPSAVQVWIQARTGQLAGGQYAPVLVMGVLSALLLGPCVAPPLAGALLYIGQTGNVWMGGAALFLLALGMGLPLVVFAAGAGTYLPKAGAWMESVTVLFGFVLLAVALWTVAPVTPAPVLLALWAMWAAVLASALWRAGTGLSMRGRVLMSALALLSAVSAAVFTVGWWARSDSVLQPLKPLTAGGSPLARADIAHADFERVPAGQVEQLLRTSEQPVMLDFYADWCVACKEFEAFTLPNPEVRKLLTGVRMVQVDVTANTPDDAALMKRYALFGPPAMLFFPASQVREVHRVIGFENADKFSATLRGTRPLLGLN